jgi:hypothetical protein
MFMVKDSLAGPRISDESVLGQLSIPEPHANGYGQKQSLAHGQMPAVLVQHPGTPISAFEDELPSSPSFPALCEDAPHPIVSSVPHELLDTRVAFEAEGALQRRSSPQKALPPVPPDCEPVIPLLGAIPQSPNGAAAEGKAQNSAPESAIADMLQTSNTSKHNLAEVIELPIDGGKKKVSWPDLHGSSLIAVREFEAR